MITFKDLFGLINRNKELKGIDIGKIDLNSNYSRSRRSNNRNRGRRSNNRNRGRRR